LRASHAHEVRLAAPGTQKAEGPAPSKSAPLKIGFGRAVPQLGTEAATSSALEWEGLPDGARVADIRLASTGAASVRAGLRIGSLPDAAVLRFQGTDDDRIFETTGRKVNEAIARNGDAGDASDAARTYWSPVIDGDTVVIEVQIPSGADPRDVRIAIAQVGHLFASPATAFATPTTIGLSGSCEVDATCSSGWSSQQNAVAEMIFSEGGGQFLCTGTLLADQDASSDIPYFLSANHCISSQTAASSLTTYWFYRSSSCNSGTAGAFRQLTGGATLLYATSSTDTSFMRLNSTPPQGTFFAGWFADSTSTAGTAVTALHHPLGDLLKISRGSVNGYENCSAPASDGSFTCSTASPSTSTFYQVGWSSGITEPGSSGSGLFIAGGYLVGQLFGGSGDCTTPGDDVYGRFDVAYNASIKSWLSPPLALTVSTTGAGSGTVDSTPSGIACGSTCSASFAPGTSVTLSPTAAAGSTFAGWGGACSGTGACSVTMSAPASVTASFQPSVQPLSVSTSGSGSVTSTPAGIDCGATCTASFPFRTSVTLSPAPVSGMVFTGWSGACSGTGSCVVSMTGPQSVTASFAAPTPTDLALSQSAMPTPATVGRDLALTLTVTNNGPATATGVAIADTLPVGSVLVAASSGCSGSPGKVACNLGSLLAGKSTQVNIVVRPSTTGSTSNDAQVSATQPDPSPANNASSLALTVGATPPANLVNISTRGEVLTGTSVMIAGFVIGGSTNKTVLVTAAGPSLGSFGIGNPLPNPTLTLVRSSDQAVVAVNDDWQSAANAAQIQASGLAPANPLESAILANLSPGAYTAIVSGVSGGTGVGLVAVYETDHPEVPLVNLSTRGAVLTGNDVMIGGFIVQGTGKQLVVVTATGPSLTAFGIASPLPNPALTIVRSSDQSVIATNDDWVGSSDAPLISAMGLGPTSPLESAVLLYLDPGAYTAIVSGVAGGTGVGVIGIYTP
jgi:uncharacterized repeat protein (TIGR01451 family)